MCSDQKTALWGCFSPSTFLWVLRIHSTARLCGKHLPRQICLACSLLFLNLSSILKIGFSFHFPNHRCPPIPWNPGTGWPECYCNCILEKTLSLTARNLSFGVRGRGKTLTWCQVTAFFPFSYPQATGWSPWVKPQIQAWKEWTYGILEEGNHFSAVQTGPLSDHNPADLYAFQNVRGLAVLQNLLGCFFFHLN